jgi:mono/diheme cytochrome c family protein
MREIIARAVCLLTVAMVVALAHLFAEKHNPPVSVPVPAQAATPIAAPNVSPVVVSPDVARGREVYNAQGCSSCHAIAHEGNPRNPLDDVGTRRTASELREWIMGTGSTVEQLSPAVIRRKQRYQELPPADLDALVAYLASLTGKP